MEIIIQIISHTLIAASVYALLSSGLTFIHATTRVFHLAHGGVVAFAAYVFWWATQVVGVSFLFGAFFACAVAVALGLLINEVVYEPLRRRKMKSFGYIAATLALLMFLGALILVVFGARTQSVYFPTPIFDILGARVTFLQIGLVIFSVTFLSALAVFVRWTRFGRAMRATADQEMVAQVLGVDTRLIRRLTMAIGSFLGGIAGIMLALEFNLDPNMGVLAAIKGFSAIVIGGPGSLVGALAGSVVLSASEQAAVWFLGAAWRSSVAFVLLFIFLLVMPSGMFGRRNRGS